MPLVGINLKDLDTQKIVNQASVALQSILPPMIEELLKDRTIEIDLKIRFRDKESVGVTATGPIQAVTHPNPVDPTS